MAAALLRITVCGYGEGGREANDLAVQRALQASPALGISALSASTKINSLASVTGRVGYSWGRFLGYVKGEHDVAV